MALIIYPARGRAHFDRPPKRLPPRVVKVGHHAAQVAYGRWVYGPSWSFLVILKDRFDLCKSCTALCGHLVARRAALRHCNTWFVGLQSVPGGLWSLLGEQARVFCCCETQVAVHLSLLSLCVYVGDCEAQESRRASRYTFARTKNAGIHERFSSRC
jgi:hypothetical protein